MLTQNQYYSYNLGELPEGCQACVRGEKLVLFTTGLCPRRCYFCPVSDEKFNHDVTFANERKVESPQAKGAGITGGDPLMKLDRTITAIKDLKAKFGKTFHIHLYTSLNMITEKNLQQLFEAGLDEIRFHLDLESKQFWPKLALARKLSWKIGVEIPMIPTKEAMIQELMIFIQDKVDFLNLNELEVADNNQSKLGEMGFKTKSSLSYAVKESLETGKRLMLNLQHQKYPLPVHLCTAKLKDAVQLSNRIKRESTRVKKRFDSVTDEGVLIRGALYLPELAPGFGYRKILESISKPDYIKKLEPFLTAIKAGLKLKEDQIFLDPLKPRILLSRYNLKKHKAFFKKLGLMPAIVMEYPTADEFEVEIEFV